MGVLIGLGFSISIIVIVWFLISWILYRIPVLDKPIDITLEVHYQMIQWHTSHRQAFEALMGYRLVTFTNGHRYFVRKKDYRLLWPESPLDMMTQHYTVVVELRTRPLWLGDYAPADVIAARHVKKAPKITK